MLKKLYIPPTLIAYCIIAMTTLFLYLPKYNLIVFPYNLVGLIIAIAGFLFMGKTRDLFRKYKTTISLDESAHLINERMFSKSRNPMYLGMFVLVFGLSIFSSNLISLLLPFIFLFLVSMIFVRKEEKLLTNTFGKEYDEYRQKVRKWI